MKRLIKKLTICLLLFLSSIVGIQAQNVTKDMTKALKLHEVSKTAKEQYQALLNMETVMKDYPKEWRPIFWASYQCTQMAMLEGRVKDFPEATTAKKLLDKSQNYLDMVMKQAGKKIGNNTRADFHVLQSLIYSFKQGMSKSEENATKYKELNEKHIGIATNLNPNSPNLLVFAATHPSLGRAKEVSYAQILASIHLLKLAKAEFEKSSERSMTTNFSQDFIQFWLPYLEKRLESVKEPIPNK